MSETTRDLNNIWKRLFDHTHFLNGEINFILNEFELKRQDKEVNELFQIVEGLTDLRDSQVRKINKLLDKNLVELNHKLIQSISLSKEVLGLEEKFKKNSILEDSRKERKVIWNQFMDDLTEQYSGINTSFEKKEQDLRGPITTSTIRIKPSEILCNYISKISSYSENVPPGISSILIKKVGICSNKFDIMHKYLLTASDFEKINSFDEPIRKDQFISSNTTKKIKVIDKTLEIQDLRWLYEYIKEQNKKNTDKVFLHELIEGSEIVLPENAKIPRNPELEKRCQKLRIQQENEHYMNMTKNVDNVRKKYPEDTIGYQMKEMNKQLIAVFQFIISVLAGFAFGFIGIELLVGSLDFGFRLLLGIIFALIVALAELYFLAKKLNEDYVYPTTYKDKSKVD